MAKLRRALSTQEDGSAAGPVDKAARLDLGDDAPAPVKASKRKGLKKRAELCPLPLTVDVSVDVGDGQEPWAFRALTGTGKTGRKAVAMECTDTNVSTLYRLVRAERASGAQEATPSNRREADRPPRAEGGARHYWNARRKLWVVKVPTQAGKYRCLTRQATPTEMPAALSASSTALAQRPDATSREGEPGDKATALGLDD